MLVVSCTVEDCDEMKKSITQGICYRGMGELLTHFKTGSFFFVPLVDALSVWESEI